MHKNWKAWLIILLLVVCIKIFSSFPLAVEKYYSTGMYPVISRALRLLFGWLPFSVGDLLYGSVAILLLVKLFRFIRDLFKKRVQRGYVWNALRSIGFYALLVYAVFNVLWGLNYNRMGTAQQLQLQMKPYTTEELDTVLQIIVARLDSTHVPALQTRQQLRKKPVLFTEAYNDYQAAKTQYAHLQYQTKSIKPSLFSYLGDYLGYTGYYNPFTGEAQVNTTVPLFVQPFTTCHEIGHQLGYAKENEANFAGYLSGKRSADPSFTYSVYFDLYNYGIRELYVRDSVRALALNKTKPQQVKKDLQELQAFYAAYENPLEPYIRKLYGQYLKANEQPAGIRSYNEVMAFLVAYYKKYGAANL
ncbi:MAG TPA: DUF3810 domain-containing protein [Chitinophagaceae bacterium]|nr:DUF3810 domain-containing protein [Chitinophagaceae bacterium]